MCTKYLDIPWRKGLKLSGETAVEKITLDGVRGLRVTLSATVHDVLYYMSPIYCQDIIDSVSNQLNRLYLKFLKRNPGYDGKVSLYGHSLGSVLSYDILCHQDNLSSPFPMDWMYREHGEDEESVPDKKSNSFHHSSINQDDTFGVKSPYDEKKSIQQTSTEMEAEFSESSVLCPALSSGNNFIVGPNSVSPSNEGEVSECISDFSDMFFDKTGALDKLESVNVGLPAAQEKCNSTNNEDDVIKKLREEIDLLNAKLAGLESCVDDDHSKEELHSVPQLSQKLPPMPDATKRYTPYINYTKLLFKVDTFFAVGSPLGVFLALRNIRIGIGRGQEYWEQENISEEIPAVRQMFNIFHPFDPVAYRVEPLVCKEYIGKRPVLIPYHRGGKRLHIGFQEFTEDLAIRTHTIKNYMKSARDRVLAVCQSRNIESIKGESSEEEEETSYGSLMMERLTGSKTGRVDHMLQDKTFEHPYLQAIGSHTNYWRDYDTALFILKHLYRDIPEDPNSSLVYSAGSSKCVTSSGGWYDQRDSVEEDVPLTFSDNVMVRNFSSKAKKIMQKNTDF